MIVRARRLTKEVDWSTNVESVPYATGNIERNFPRGYELPGSVNQAAFPT
jgi:hypothetical protein